MFGNSLWKVAVSRTVVNINMVANKLFVGNLSFNTTENDLQDAFAAFGTVTRSEPDDGSLDQPPPLVWFRNHEFNRKKPKGD